MKNMINKTWTNKLYTFDNIIKFNKEVLKKYINKFWNENIDLLDNDSHILLITRFRRENGYITTIGELQRLNKDDKEYLLSNELVILGKDLSGVHSTEFDNSFVLLFLAELNIISIISLPKSEL